jgi:hypothetical protein
MIKVGQLLQQNTYTAQLQTEEWKSFARGVRASYENACAVCRRSDTQTQVHHIFYDPSLKLWEYQSDDVMLLCTDCHKAFHEQLRNFRRHVFRHMRPGQLKILNGALLVGLTQHDPTEFVHAVAELAASPGSVQRFAYAWNGGKKPEPQ